MPVKVFYSFFILILLVLLCTIPALAQDSIPHQNTALGKLHILYLMGGKQYTIDTSLSTLIDNEDIRLVESVRKIDGGQTLLLGISAKKDLVLQEFSVILPEKLDSANSVFCNGFQSWTTSREYGLDEKIQRMGPVGKAFAAHYGDYNYYKYTGKQSMLHGWAYTYLRKQNGQIVFTGSVNEYSGYTLFLHDAKQQQLTVSKDCNGLKIAANNNFEGIHLLMLQGDDDSVFNDYATQFNSNLAVTASYSGLTLQASKAKPALGWTSWYNYYNRISSDTILANLNNFKDRKIPIKMFQIDDGYQLSTGDWLLTNTQFSKGMKPIADSIHKAGYQAGIWLAPFICERKSVVYAQHPDWLLKNDKGKAIVVGYNPLWSGNYYALDIYNPAVREYLKTVFDTVLRKWGYDMVKLDFLFAAALNPPRDKTRGQVMTDAMMLLRQLVGNDKFIDGCGVPIGPAFILTDYCRVSSDVHRKWEQRMLKLLKARERLSVWNSLTTVIGRQQLAGRMFQSDPDVFILRTENQHLNAEQKHTMLLVDNLFGKLVLMSDNISRYDSAQMAQYLSAFPYTDKENIKVKVLEKSFYKITFTTQGRNYLALINLSGKSKNYKLDDSTYFDGQQNRIRQKGNTLNLKAYQSLCLYRLANNGFEVLGGGNNLFTGMEIEQISLKSDHNINLKYRKGAQHTQPILIKIPVEFTHIQVNGKTTKMIDVGGIKCLFYVP